MVYVTHDDGAERYGSNDPKGRQGGCHGGNREFGVQGLTMNRNGPGDLLETSRTRTSWR